MGHKVKRGKPSSPHQESTIGLVWNGAHGSVMLDNWLDAEEVMSYPDVSFQTVKVKS